MQLVDVSNAVAGTRSRLKKRAILADCLRSKLYTGQTGEPAPGDG